MSKDGVAPSYQGRDYYYMEDGKENFTLPTKFQEPFRRNPPHWEHVADPFSCRNCYSNKRTYGMNYQPFYPPPPEMYVNPPDMPQKCGDCYSHLPNYGMKFGAMFEKYWTCAQGPNGCKEKRMVGAIGVI